jgi:hypothetical protein
MIFRKYAIIGHIAQIGMRVMRIVNKKRLISPKNRITDPNLTKPGTERSSEANVSLFGLRLRNDFFPCVVVYSLQELFQYFYKHSDTRVVHTKKCWYHSDYLLVEEVIHQNQASKTQKLIYSGDSNVQSDKHH